MRTADTIQRLKQMTPGELAHRIGRIARKATVRTGLLLGNRTVSDREYLKSVHNEAVLLWNNLARLPDQTTVQLSACYRTHCQSAADQSLQRAKDCLVGCYPLFGESVFKGGTAINWNVDPITGNRWTLEFWEKALSKGLSAGWDPKPIWELNFQHHLLDLGKAYCLTGEEIFAKTAVDSVLTWIEQNPPERGIHWAESVVIGIRVIVWLITLPLFAGSQSLSDSVILQIRKSLWAQIHHIEDFLSTYVSPNTHLIGEGAALFLAGALLAGQKESKRWIETGRGILEAAIDVHFDKEGFYRERSIYYHCYAMEFYLLVLVAARRFGLTLSRNIWAAVERGLEVLACFVRPDGTLPRWGDDDGGRILKFDERTYGSAGGLMCLGALLFERPDFKFIAGTYREEALWLLGPESHEQYARISAEAPASLTRLCASTGIFIDRSRWDSRADSVLFLAGDMGMLSGGHSHADCLSLEVVCGGHPFLIDPGTYVYSGDAAWRNAFRGTPYHNTVTVDKASQAELGGTFKWRSRWFSSPIEYLSTNWCSVVSASHNGFSRLPDPVFHRRTLLSIKPAYWVCIDQLIGKGMHDYEWAFHFAPGIEVETNQLGQVVTTSDKRASLILEPVHFSVTTSFDVLPSGDPQDSGWYSPLYGTKTRTPLFRVRESRPGICVRAYVMYAGSSGRNSAINVRDLRKELSDSVDAQDVVACSVPTEAYDDIIFYSPGQVRHWIWNGLSCTSEMVIARFSRDGQMLSAILIRARNLAWRDKMRVQCTEEFEYVHLDCASEPVRLESTGGGKVEIWNNGTRHEFDWSLPGLKRVCVG